MSRLRVGAIAHAVAAEQSAAKLQNHLDLLRNEHRKLLQRNNELERLVSTSSAAGSTSLGSSLLSTVANIFGKDTDISIVAEERAIPAHKVVLASRGTWSTQPLASVSEIRLAEVSHAVARSLLGWVYTDSLDDATLDVPAMLELIRGAALFKLKELVNRLETGLIGKINSRNCIAILVASHDIGATSLKKFAIDIVMDRWDELDPHEFASLSADLFYEMVKQKSKFPLHAAVKHGREDVVFLFLIENDSILKTKANEVDDDGCTPLELALRKKHEGIAKSLVRTHVYCNHFVKFEQVSHAANVNVVKPGADSLLHHFVAASDVFASLFLIQNGCDVYAVDKQKRSALHIAAAQNLEDVCRALIARGTPINMRDDQGNTAIQCAILNKLAAIATLLLEQRDIDLNSRNNDGYSALWMALSLDDQSFARTLVQRGCDVNLTLASGDSMLHHAIKIKNERASIFLIENGALVDLKNLAKESPLHLTALNAMSSVAELLVSKGAQINVVDGQLRTPLHNAVLAKSVEIAGKLLSQPNLQVDVYDNSNASPLSFALQTAQFELAKQLLGSGASVEGNLAGGTSLLHQAILRKDDDSVRFLLENKANVMKLTREHVSPLHLAISQQKESIVDLLCVHAADVNAVDAQGVSPLWAALSSKQLGIAAILVKSQCQLDPILNGFGPIHTAISVGDEVAAAFLISHGSNVNENSNGEQLAPIHMAAEKGLSQTLGALLRSGADVNIRDAKLQTALHRAIQAKQRESIQILLQDKKINLSIANGDDRTVFGVALLNRDQETAKSILQFHKGAAEEANARGLTFLHTAVNSGDVESVQFLLQVGVNLNTPVRDPSQRTALVLAVANGNTAITDMLLRAKADLTVRDPTSKWTPLHVAASAGNNEIVTMLLRAGADSNAQDELGETPLHAAARSGHKSVCEKLMAHDETNVSALNAKQQTPLHMLGLHPRETSLSIFQVLARRIGEINPVDGDGNTPLFYAYRNNAAPLAKALIQAGAHLALPNSQGQCCFDVEVETKRLLYQLIDTIRVEPQWIELPFCQVCRQKFSVTTRKHHCRHCGRIVCAKCSPQSVKIPKLGEKKAARVCDDCCTVLKGGE